MAYAIIRTGGKQFRVTPGQTIRIPTIESDEGATVNFDDVLLAAGDNGIQTGTPVLSGARVTGQVVRHGKDRKIVVFKFKRRKNYSRKQGHRQKFTEVRIQDIQLG